jgi:hypothetical protein
MCASLHAGVESSDSMRASPNGHPLAPRSAEQSATLTAARMKVVRTILRRTDLRSSCRRSEIPLIPNMAPIRRHSSMRRFQRECACEKTSFHSDDRLARLSGVYESDVLNDPLWRVELTWPGMPFAIASRKKSCRTGRRTKAPIWHSKSCPISSAGRIRCSALRGAPHGP